MNVRDKFNLEKLASGKEINMDPLWLPFTPNRRFKASPRLIENAEDMYYKTSTGKSILDGIADCGALTQGIAANR